MWERMRGGCFCIMEFLKLFNQEDVIQKPPVPSACFCLFQISSFSIFNYLWEGSGDSPALSNNYKTNALNSSRYSK